MSNTNAKVPTSITLNWMKNSSAYWIEYYNEDPSCLSVGDIYFVRMIGDEPNWALYKLCPDTETMHYLRLPTSTELPGIEWVYTRGCASERSIYGFLY